MVKFLWLILLSPVERFLAQWISVSTEPSAYVRERIRLGDTTNFLRAAGFFISAISTAFLAEVATLYLLGIEGLTEPYYWLFILLTSIPFVLIAFVLLRLVGPLTLKDVLHLSLYPIGAGVFTGAAFALVASGVVALLVAVGYLPEIKYDFTQWGETEEQGIAVLKRAMYDCYKQESLTFRIVAAGGRGGQKGACFPISGEARNSWPIWRSFTLPLPNADRRRIYNYLHGAPWPFDASKGEIEAAGERWQLQQDEIKRGK